MAIPKQKSKASQDHEKWYQSLWVKIVGAVSVVVLFLTLVNEGFSFKNNVGNIITPPPPVIEDKIDDVVVEASQLRVIYEHFNYDSWKSDVAYSLIVKSTGKTVIIQDSIKIIKSQIKHDNVKVYEWFENRPIELSTSPMVTNKYLSTKDDKGIVSLRFKLNFYPTASIVYEKAGSIFEVGNVVVSIPYKLPDGKIRMNVQSIPIVVEVVDNQ